MISLRELQSQFMRALLDGVVESASRAVRNTEISPDQRIGLYRVNVSANFLDALRSSYPVVRRLVGEDYFNQVARSFHRLNPSESGDLQPAGSGFAEHLAAVHASDGYRYLKDVAAFEWTVQEVLLGAEHPPLDLTKLRQVAPADYESLRFLFHPTARLFRSEFPCLKIWRSNIDEALEPDVISLDDGPEHLLLLRACGRLSVHRLTGAEERFLSALEGGASLKAALDRGGSDLDASASLTRFYTNSAIVDVECERSRLQKRDTRHARPRKDS